MIEERTISDNALETMMGELPIGSYVRMTAATFQVVMPLNGITTVFDSKAHIVFEAKTLDQAYKDSVLFLDCFQRVVNEQ